MAERLLHAVYTDHLRLAAISAPTGT